MKPLINNNSDMIPTHTTSLPKLLQLPLELRQQIYSHLCPASPISNPIPTVGITSVSHAPPPVSFLLTSRAVYSDLLPYFFSIATWKLIASHAFNFYRIDPTLSNFAASFLLHKIQKVELVLWFDGSLLKSYPSLKTQTYCMEIRKRATRTCEILAAAPELRTLTVSWIDSTVEEAMEEKRDVLDALRRLDVNVMIEVGVLEWSGAQAGHDKERFEGKMKGFIRDARPVAAL
ncbi:unnamed protein product [Aureobasidium uvarum]|uniref:F-box domain-containing protein n=1 Tax=Aureobasidium uvarum TaxID=2773716 RepID=A0A9N8KJU7_9PEZI|nr:unnamed protein product [Aureobasidium uvarum]